VDNRPVSNQSVLASRTAYPVRDTLYPRIVSGRGPFLISETGDEYLDASGGSGSLIFGHGDPQMVAALTAQAQTLTVFPSRSFSVEIVERYMGELVAFTPPGLARALTFSSGSDAVEAAIKLSLQFHFLSGHVQKTKLIGRRGSYHGNTLAGLSAGGFISRRKPYEAVLARVCKVASAHCSACEFGQIPTECEVECAGSLEEAILLEGPERVAAVILEPVVGAALSAATPDPRYLSRIRSICDRYDILLIFDEVMSGFGRTGQPFSCQIWNVIPDILVCGKGMSAGYYPLSGLIVAPRVAEVFGGSLGPFQNGNTHACSPTGAAVGLAVIERFKHQPILENASLMGSELRERLADKHLNSTLANVRGEGLMIGFDIEPQNQIRAWRTRTGEAAERLQQAALRQGLIIYASSGGAGSEAGDHAMLLPPLTIGPQEVDLIVAALTAAVRDPIFTEALS
jgi:adenosylmethionine-8-amino-7-oxononanoate aminotransferase